MSGVRKNYIFNLINTLSGLLFPLITFPYAARVLLPEGIGQVNFFISIITWISLFTGLGIPLYAIREIARVKDEPVRTARTTAEILILHTVLTLAGYLLVAVLCLTIPEIRENAPVFLVLSIQLIFTVIGCEWFYQGIEEFRFITIRNIIVKAASVVLLFLLVKTRDDLIQYAVFSVIGTVGNNVFNFIRLRRYIGGKVGRLRGLNIGRHVKPALRIFALNIVTSFYMQLGTVMLGFISGSAAVGYYTSATKLSRMLLGILTALGTVMIPKMSHLYATGDTAEFNRLCTKSMTFVNFLGLPMAAGLAILAPSLIYLFCGPAYEPAGLTLRLISPIIIIIGISNVIGVQILYPQGKEKLILISNIVGAAVNFVLNLLLIPKYQHDGAAVATVAAELGVTLTQMIIARKYIPVKVISGQFLNYYTGTLIMAAICIGLSLLNLDNWFKITIIPLAGIASYTLFLLLRKDPLLLSLQRGLRG